MALSNHHSALPKKEWRLLGLSSVRRHAFEYMRGGLITQPILTLPDFEIPFFLDTDASNMPIGAVLSQNINGKEQVVAYASRVLTTCERRFCTDDNFLSEQTTAR